MVREEGRQTLDGLSHPGALNCTFSTLLCPPVAMLILSAYAAACNALPNHLHQQTPLVPSHTADVSSREPSRTALAPAPQPPSTSLTVLFWPVPPKDLEGQSHARALSGLFLGLV